MDIEHDWTYVPVCPYCGDKKEEWFVCMGLEKDGDNRDMECDSCAKIYKATIHIPDPHFSSEKKE